MPGIKIFLHRVFAIFLFIIFSLIFSCNTLMEDLDGDVAEETVSSEAESSENSITYIVSHYWQNVDDNAYTFHESEEMTGEIDEYTNASSKAYTGFTATEFSQKLLTEGSSVVVQINYDRSENILKYDDGVDDETIAVPSSGTYRYGKSISLSFDVGTRTGYTFTGWNTASDGSGTSYTSSGTSTIEMGDEDITLYAQWEVISITMKSGSQIYSILAGSPINAYSSTLDSFKPYSATLTAEELNALDKVTLSTDDSSVPCYAWLDSGSNTVYYYAEGYTDSGKLIPLTSCENMFQYLSFTSIDLSGFDTSSVTSMEKMFSACSNLTTVNLSTFDTSKVTSMGYMFNGCSSLTAISLSNFTTVELTYMSNMFAGCSSLTSLDLSTFETDKVTSMTYTFNGASSLTTIYVTSSKFSTVSVTSDSDMFSGCTSLMGGAGTAYNSSKVDSAYAHVDSSGNPGYFTER